MKFVKFYTCLFCLLAISETAFSQAVLSIQGIIQKSTGAAVDDGNYSLLFQLYTAETGGAVVHTETQTVPVVGGIYSTELGKTNALTAGFNQSYWLGVSVDGATELVPRIRLTSAPYALALLGQSNVFPSTGAVGIGTTNPLSELAIYPNNDGSKITLFDGGDAVNQFGFGINGGQLNYHVQAHGHHVFYAGGKNGDGLELLRIKQNGNIGLGTTNPLSPLSIYPSYDGSKITLFDGSDANNHYGFGINAGQLNYHVKADGHHVFYFGGKNGNGTEMVRIKSNGMDVAGRLNINAGAWGDFIAGKFFNEYSTGLQTFAAGPQPVSIYAASNILTSAGFLAASDRRIKKDIEPSNHGKDLSALLQLRVTDYRYIDLMGHGGQTKKGFIAQEVGAVFPEAISLSDNFIPNVYELAAKTALADGGLLLISLGKKHGFAPGDEVKLIFPDGEKTLAVEAAPSENTFSIKWTAAAAPEKTFVFGKKVSDFHTVDYDRIFTLNVSATQELARKMEILEKENAALKLELAKSKLENGEMKASAEKMDARLRAIENRLSN